MIHLRLCVTLHFPPFLHLPLDQGVQRRANDIGARAAISQCHRLKIKKNYFNIFFLKKKTLIYGSRQYSKIS